MSRPKGEKPAEAKTSAHALRSSLEKACPQCNSKRLYKDGLRYTNSEAVQRFLCRDCGYRFSENSNKNHQIDRERQLCVTETKKLDTATENKTVAGEKTCDPNGIILDFAWQLKKRGLAESTIKQRVHRLRQLVKKGADLDAPDTISTILATSNWSESNKRVFIVAYKSFAKTYKLEWDAPKTRVEDKIPFIPTEDEINQLIAGCGKKTATFLQVLKDTAARTAEAAKLKWIDIDEQKTTIRINNPVKGSRARIVKVKPKTIAMLNKLQKTSEYIFNTHAHTIRQNYYKQRRRIANLTQNPRLMQIRLHTFRHWKATMEYHRTKNIKHVQRLLGHKKLEHTDRYTQLIDLESDEYNVAHALTLEEENKLIEAGFEYVRYSQKDEVAIYRKPK
jgi:integrase/recombinase XerD